jgi:hypothetical protein
MVCQRSNAEVWISIELALRGAAFEVWCMRIWRCALLHDILGHCFASRISSTACHTSCAKVQCEGSSCVSLSSWCWHHPVNRIGMAARLTFPHVVHLGS